ncbi:MAG: threonine synthase [Christensenellales bacterium]|jgi:threonine synthase
MRFISSRGKANPVSAPEAVLSGIAPDGGLYLPDTLPCLDWQTLPQDYPALATAIFEALLPGFAPDTLRVISQAAYTGRFDSPQVAPLVPLGDEAYVLELFHGPTAAFKDLALSVLPRLMVSARDQLMPGRPILVLTATSGDTGSAAMAGFQDLPGTRVTVFYPEGGVSPVQRAQMLGLSGGNLAAYAIQGDFDAAQAGVKAVFAKEGELGFPAGLLLSSANSINIGRLVPQVAYYFSAYQSLVHEGAIRAGEPLHAVVPSGNFGDILAGYLAKRMGLPLGKLVCASNQNRVLTDFLESGRYDRRRRLHLSVSPSMDILVSSNVERLIYLASDGASALVSGLMTQLNVQGHYQLPEDVLAEIKNDFLAVSATETDTLAAIRQVWEEQRYVLDPHAAVAWHGYQQLRHQLPGKTLVLATASPFKFPRTVLKALGEAKAEDGLCGMAALSDKTEIPIPPALAWLKGTQSAGEPVIDPAAIPQTALQEANRC